MVPELVLGTAQFEASYGIVRQAVGHPEARELIELAQALGVTSLDTSPAYGSAQEMIGSCGWQGDIHTKIPGHEDVLGSLRDSLTSLRCERVEVSYFHDPNVLHLAEDFFEETHAAIVPQRANHLGVSIYSPEEFNAALDNSFLTVIQAPMSIVDYRISDEQLEQAALTKKLVFARSVFLQGVLLQDLPALPKFLTDITPVLQQLQSISSETGLNRMEILMQAVLARPGISGIVVGAETTGQLGEIASAFKAQPLSPDLQEQFSAMKSQPLDLIDPRRWPKGWKSKQ